MPEHDRGHGLMADVRDGAAVWVCLHPDHVIAPIGALTGSARPPLPVYREVQRAEQAGLVTSRKVGNTRLVRANTASPYYAGLSEVLTRAFGVPLS